MVHFSAGICLLFPWRNTAVSHKQMGQAALHEQRGRFQIAKCQQLIPPLISPLKIPLNR